MEMGRGIETIIKVEQLIDTNQTIQKYKKINLKF
jgi:hypothetical protein